MIKISLGTIKGRHQLPVTDYVFNEEIQDVTDVEKIQQDVDYYFNELNKTCNDKVQIILYVTGLTVVTLAIVKACKRLRYELIAMHFDRDNNCYFGQKVL
jgi:hypothetical protein